MLNTYDLMVINHGLANAGTLSVKINIKEDFKACCI